MLICELPDAGGKTIRAGLIGSCRLHDPLKAAMPAFDGKFIWSANNAFTHSPHEAWQHYQLQHGDIQIPDAFAPYVMRQERFPIWPDDLREKIGSCDTLVVEVSSLESLSCGGYFFNHDYFAQGFVRGKGLPVMNWFRTVGPNGPDRKTTNAAANSMAESGTPVTPSKREILRTLSQTTATKESVGAVFDKFRACANRLVLVPIFDIEDGTDALRASRGQIADILRDEAARLDAGFVDPSPIVVKQGRKAALDGDGADVFHYAPDFLPEIGKALMEKIFDLRVK